MASFGRWLLYLGQTRFLYDKQIIDGSLQKETTKERATQNADGRMRLWTGKEKRASSNNSRGCNDIVRIAPPDRYLALDLVERSTDSDTDAVRLLRPGRYMAGKTQKAAEQVTKKLPRHLH